MDWFEAVAWLRMENIVAIIIMCEDRFDNALQHCLILKKLLLNIVEYMQGQV